MQIPERLSKRRLRWGILGSIEQDEYGDIIAAFVYLEGGQARRQKIIDTIHGGIRRNSRPPIMSRYRGYCDGGQATLIIVISSGNPELSPFANAALRFSESVIGAAIAVLAVLLWPKTKEAT